MISWESLAWRGGRLLGYGDVGDKSVGRGGVRSGGSEREGEKSVWMEIICCERISATTSGRSAH